MSTLNKYQRAGRKGGKSTVKKYGRSHMANIGKKGAQVFHAKYILVPFMMTDFLIVEKSTGKPLPKTLCGATITATQESRRYDVIQEASIQA